MINDPNEEPVAVERREEKETPKRSTIKPRKFFKMSRVIRGGGAVGLKLLNKDLLVQAGKRLTFGPDPGTRGFPVYPEAPHFLFDRRLGRDVQDIETYTAYWLISDRMKRVLESVDPAGFAFCKCKTELRNGEEGPPYWLCDVLRVLDAVDEENSNVAIKRGEDGKVLQYLGLAKTCFFRKNVTESLDVFRLFYFSPQVICSDRMRLACTVENLKGIKFLDVGIEQ